MKQMGPGVDLERLAIDMDDCHLVLPPWATFLADVALEVLAKVLERTLQGFHGTRGMGAEGPAGTEKLGMQLEHIQIQGRAPALFQRDQDLFDPGQPIAAGRTPAAGLLGEEVLEIPYHADRTGAVVQHDQGAGAQAATRLLDGIVIHGQVQVLLHQKVGGSPARHQTAERVTIAHAASVLLQELAKGGPHGQLPGPGPFDPAARPEDLGPAVLTKAQRPVPVSAPHNDVRYVAEGLHVVDDGGFAPEATELREGWPCPWDGALALERGEQGSLLAADIAAGACMQMELQVIARIQDIPAEITGVIRLADGLVEPPGRERVFSAQEDVGDLGLDGIGGHD